VLPSVLEVSTLVYLMGPCAWAAGATAVGKVPGPMFNFGRLLPVYVLFSFLRAP
jgi:hypothetical protein